MSSTVMATVAEMLASLPEPLQEEVAQHLREYMADLQDEAEWQAQFDRTQPQLVAAARRAKAEMAEGQVEPLDHERL